MSNNKKDRAEDVVPGKDNFNFGAYIAGKSTFPKFQHTVYLDQEAGMALVKLSDEYTELVERAKEIGRIQNHMGERVTGRALVDTDMEELLEELRGIESKTDEMGDEIKKLNDEIVDSALTLTFQAGTAQKLGQTVRRAEKEYYKQHGRGEDDDIEYLTAKSRWVMAAQLAAYCVKIQDSNGKSIPVPDRDGFLDLLDLLISSESVRLVEALNKSLDSSITWANRLDAGFPGGGTDLGQLPLGSAGTEDGALLGSAPVALADREEV